MFCLTFHTIETAQRYSNLDQIWETETGFTVFLYAFCIYLSIVNLMFITNTSNKQTSKNNIQEWFVTYEYSVGKYFSTFSYVFRVTHSKEQIFYFWTSGGLRKTFYIYLSVKKVTGMEGWICLWFQALFILFYFHKYFPFWREVWLASFNID